MKFLSRTSSKGFTLIELLVVIFIIGLLAAIVIVATTSARAKARDARRKADIKSIKTALEMYYDTGRQYPQKTGGCDNCPFSVSDTDFVNLLKPYLNPMPSDPSVSATHEDYQYVRGPATSNNYGLKVTFESLTFSGSNTCKTGLNLNSDWWAAVPLCDF